MDPQTIGLLITFTLLYISELTPFLPMEAQGIFHGLFGVLAAIKLPIRM
jgi:hypothetical protein